MNDHFWPSIYPGLIVALLIGVATGGIVAIATGLVGGLAGSVGAYLLTTYLGLDESALSLAILLAGATGGGYLGTQAGSRLRKPRG